MKELLNQDKIFQLAKENVIKELEKEHESLIEAINIKEIERDEIFIKQQIGAIVEEEYREKDRIALKEINELKPQIKQVLRKIRLVKDVNS